MTKKVKQIKLRNIPFTESEIKRLIKDYLKIRGWYSFSILQGIGAHKGIADIYAIKGGRGIWIEVKSSRGKQSADQIEFQKNIEYHGGEYLLVRCLDDLIDKGI